MNMEHLDKDTASTLEEMIEKIILIGNPDKDTTRFDTTRFKAEQPEVYAEYCKTSTVHSFTVRELIEK